MAIVGVGRSCGTETANFLFWHLADTNTAGDHFRFEGKSGHLGMPMDPGVGSAHADRELLLKRQVSQ